MRKVCGKSCRPSRIRSLCGHCGENLSSSQYARHKRLYFDESSQSWKRDLASPVSFSAPDPFEFTSKYSSDEESMPEMCTTGEGKPGRLSSLFIFYFLNFKAVHVRSGWAPVLPDSF